MTNGYEKPKQVVVVGDGSCGKTYLVMMFEDYGCQNEYLPTIRTQFTKELTVDSRQVIRTCFVHCTLLLLVLHWIFIIICYYFT